MDKMTPEARLEKLKADIARRKLERQQGLQTPEARKADSDTSVRTKDDSSSTSEKKQRKLFTAKKPKAEIEITDNVDKNGVCLSGNETEKLPGKLLKHERKTKGIKTLEKDLTDNDVSIIGKESPKKRERRDSKEKTSPEVKNKTNEEDASMDSGSPERKRRKRETKLRKRRSRHLSTEASISGPDDDDDDGGDDEKSRTDPDLSQQDGEEDDDDDEDSDATAEKDDAGTEADHNVIGGFSVLGDFTHEPVKPVKRKLPDWLANPTIIGGGLKKRRLESAVKEEAEDEAVMKILDGDLRRNLSENGIHSFFPVQRQFIPEIWKDLKFSIMSGRYGLRPRDFCVSAPTGSGKTLAYTLPIIQCLKQRWEAHVSAVVVLPVRDLAEQVFQVFCQYCRGTPLKVGLAVGKSTFSVEQETLVCEGQGQVYHSLVDIVVATPGRLVDHISSTPGFDLSHLRFLVIDEADRMMEDIKYDWLSAVERAAYSVAPQAYRPLSRSLPGPLTLASAQCNQLPLQKLLFSATLSHNPEKLERLNLFMPRLMTSVVLSQSAPALAQGQGQGQGQDDHGQEGREKEVTEESTENTDGGFVGKYTTPEGLTEYLMECEASEKPLVMLHFMHNLKFRSVLCFTNSLETTHRLCLLVRLFGEGLTVKEFSSRQPAERRKKILRQFALGKIDLLVCSDVMARGMDVDNVKYVVSYDNPPFVKTYIHRVGRTARAGRAGTAISLLEKKEFFHFKKMMREAGKWGSIREMKLSRQALKPLVEPFQAALSKLPLIIKGEKKKQSKS